MALAERIRIRRQALHLTQEALAARLGVSQATISRLENGTGNIHMDMLRRLADVLEEQPAELAALAVQVAAAA